MANHNGRYSGPAKRISSLCTGTGVFSVAVPFKAARLILAEDGVWWSARHMSW